MAGERRGIVANRNKERRGNDGWRAVLNRPRAAAAIGLALIVLGVLLARAVPCAPYVLLEDGAVRLLGNDPYYHLRHSKFASRHYPKLQKWDAGTNYPTGQFAEPVGLFNLGVATVSRALALGRHSDRTVELVSAWASPALGALCVLLLYGLARECLPRGIALVVCLLYLAFPGGSLDRTLLGFGDHHAAEMVLGLLTIWGYARAVETPMTGKRGWRGALLLYPAPLAAFQLTWHGAAMLIPILGFALWAQLTFELARGKSGLGFCAGNALYFAGFILWCLFGWRILDLWVTGVPPPLVIGSALFLAAAPAAYAGGCALVRKKVAPPAAAAIGAATALGTGWAAYSREGVIRENLNYLLSPKAEIVAEHLPVSPEVFWEFQGVSGVLAVAALPAVLAASWMWKRRRSRVSEREAAPSEQKEGRVTREAAAGEWPLGAPAALLLAFGYAWLYLWIKTSDYSYAAPVYSALLAGFALLPAAIWLEWRGPGTPGRRGRGIVAGLGVTALLAPAWPLSWTNPPWKEAEEMRRFTKPTRGLMEAMAWMREHTPEPPVTPLTAVEPFGGRFHYPAGSYGVMSTWDNGNYVAALGNRVPVWSRYPDARTVLFMLETDPEKTLQRLCPDCREGDRVRYVVLTPEALAQQFLGKIRTIGGDPGRFLEYHQSVRFDGREIPIGSYGARQNETIAGRLFFQDGAGESRYRLCYESRARCFYRFTYLPEIRSFIGQATGVESPQDEERYKSWLASGSVWREPEGYGYFGRFVPGAKVFEAVRGAAISGIAPGSRAVVAALRLRVESTGRDIVFRKKVPVAEGGRFEITVPYATVDAPPGVSPQEPAYHLAGLGQDGLERWQIRIAVTEAQIQDGGMIRLTRISPGAR